MQKSSKRPQQIGELIQQNLSLLLSRNVKDPRLKYLSISSVDVSPDLKLARIYFTLLANENELAQVNNSLKKAAGFLRAQLAQDLHLRYTPRLEFIYDKTLDTAHRISELLSDTDLPEDDDNEEKSS